MDTGKIRQLHLPVMRDAVIRALSPRDGERYLDGTLGLGGHAEAILQHAPQCFLCGLDQDADAIRLAQNRLEAYGSRVKYFHMRFGAFPKALRALDWPDVNGVLLDLGVSSMQLDEPGRGFSFRSNGRLDMRMNQASGAKSAWHMVNHASFDELKDCIATLGEEPLAGKIARRIVQERQKQTIDDTVRLAEIVSGAYPAAWRRKSRRHPATRTFQALRMAVNDELGQLREFLREILPWIAPGGRLVVITFHSLEDRLVKHAMRDWAKGCICPPHIARCQCGHQPEVRIMYRKPLVAGTDEVLENPRATSAKLRAVEKLAVSGI